MIREREQEVSLSDNYLFRNTWHIHQISASKCPSNFKPDRLIQAPFIKLSWKD